jgi:hypothetical protein
VRSGPTFGRIENNPRGVRLDIIQKMGEAVSRKPKQTVVNVEIIDLDQFDSRGSGWKGMKIPHRKIREGVAFEAKIKL